MSMGSRSPATARPGETTEAESDARRARSSGLGVASLAVAVAFVGLFDGLLQYLPLAVPPIGVVLGSTAGSHALLWSELAGMVAALVLGITAIATRRGRGHGIAAVIIGATVTADLLAILLPFGGPR